MAKQISQNGLNLIKEFEGCRLTAYKCPAGVWTIGYGHTGGVTSGMKISQQKADEFLFSDCQKFVGYVNNPSYVPLTEQLNQNQFDALVSFAFNCGQGNLKTLCANRSLAQIADKLLLYNKGGGKVLAGLTRRRNRERELFLSGGNTGTTPPPANNTPASTGYSKTQFVKDVQGATGSKVDGIPGSETLGNTVTVSAKVNRTHPVVKAIQKRLNALGYDCGTADGIAGQKFTNAVNNYQKNVLGYARPDGEITKKGKMWKSLLGM